MEQTEKTSLPQKRNQIDSGASISIGVKGFNGCDSYRMAAMRSDDGELTIGVFNYNVKINEKPFVKFGHAGDQHIAAFWDIDAAPNIYTQSSQVSRMGFEDWQGLIVAYMANILSDTRNLTCEQWLVRVAEFTLPKSSSLEDLESLPAASLRHLAAAHQLQCASVKKQDIVKALADHMNDLWQAGKYGSQPGCHEAVLGYNHLPPAPKEGRVIGMKINGAIGSSSSGVGSPDVHDMGDFLSGQPQRYVVSDMDSDCILGDVMAPWREVNAIEECAGKPLRFTVQSCTRTIERKSFDMVAKLAEFNPEMHYTLDTMFRMLKAEAIGRSAMIEEASRSMGLLLTEARESLSLYEKATKATVPECAASDDGSEVEVSGEWFPNYKSPDAPAMLANYSMDFWRAEQRMGRGSETVEFNAADLAAAIIHEGVVSLVGPPGVGKTSIVQQLAAVIGVPVFTIAFTKEKPVEQLIGCDKIVKGQQVWVDGEITRALRLAATSTTPVFIMLDERDHADPSVQSELHAVLERRPLCLPDGEIIPIGDNVCFILTSNTSGHGDTTGRHSAANMSDTAFNSRVKCTFNVSYLRPEDEQGLLVINGLSVSEAKEMVSFANSTRESVAQMDSGSTFDGMSEAVCLRHMLGYASCRARGMEMKKAFSATILASLPQSDRLVANELAIQKVSFYG